MDEAGRATPVGVAPGVTATAGLATPTRATTAPTVTVIPFSRPMLIPSAITLPFIGMTPDRLGWLRRHAVVSQFPQFCLLAKSERGRLIATPLRWWVCAIGELEPQTRWSSGPFWLVGAALVD